MKKNKKPFILIAIPLILFLIIIRFVIFYIKSDGFSGISYPLPLLAMGILIFAILMSTFFSIWVYQDCKKRGDDGVLWAIITFIATPFLGLIIYFIRRSEIKDICSSCGHRISKKAKYCEECGTKVERQEELIVMERNKTHHIRYIIMGTICMFVTLACLTGFIVTATSGQGVNTNITSNEKIWNLGMISMNNQTVRDGIWTLDFRSASDGFIAQEDMVISNSDKNHLIADIQCGSVPNDAKLTLYLVQDDVVKYFDVTNLAEPLDYSLEDFENGKIHVRLLIEGVEDTVSIIQIK